MIFRPKGTKTSKNTKIINFERKTSGHLQLTTGQHAPQAYGINKYPIKTYIQAIKRPKKPLKLKL